MIEVEEYSPSWLLQSKLNLTYQHSYLKERDLTIWKDQGIQSIIQKCYNIHKAHQLVGGMPAGIQVSGTLSSVVKLIQS